MRASSNFTLSVVSLSSNSFKNCDSGMFQGYGSTVKVVKNFSLK